MNINTSYSRPLTSSYNKLSTGKRINSAADDAAGLAISQKMEAQTSAMKQGVNNLKDGNNFIKVSDGALDSITSIVQDIYKSYVQMGNGTYSTSDKQIIQNDIDKKIEAINGIVKGTNFNGINAFNGKTLTLHDGESSKNLNTREVKLDLSSMESTKKSLESLMSQRGELGAQYNANEHHIVNNENSIIQTKESLSRISDTDMAKEITEMKRLSTLERMSFFIKQKQMQRNKEENDITKYLM